MGDVDAPFSINGYLQPPGEAVLMRADGAGNYFFAGTHGRVQRCGVPG